MGKKFLGLRIEDTLKDNIERVAESNSETITDTVERALRLFLSSDTGKPDIHNIESRLRALETKFDRRPTPTPTLKSKTPKEPTDPDDLGELITLDEIENLTGYAKSTLSSKLSKNDVQAKKRLKGNRGGLYSKTEVLARIGYK